MPSLLDRIRAIFRPSQQAEEPASVIESQPPRKPTDLISRFQAETERAAIVRKCREMYKKDPRAKKMLRILARDMVKGGFAVKTEDARALDVATALKKRLNLDQKMDDYVRLSARDGDSFLELAINDRLEIVSITRKPTLEIHRNSNKYDRFEDPERAYWWADTAWIAQDPPADAIWFADWQIVHARWEHDEGSRYGTPMMASGTGHYKKVEEGELDISVRRKTRAGMKYLHEIEGADEADLMEYKENNKDALDNPFAAVADFFTNKKGSITAIQGDARLGEIGDVQHMIATWFTAGEVPMELVAYGENLNRDVLKEKKTEYDETLEQLRNWVTAELVKPILERQWLLAGIYPPNLEYSIEWQSKMLITPEDVRAIAEAAMRLRILGIPDPVIWTILGRFLPGIDVEKLMQSMDGQGTEVDRIAGTLSSLRGGL
jgi:hypothetical protein